MAARSAEVEAPGASAQTHDSLLPLQSALHGTKRRADEDLQRDQRLSKRFDLLNLDNRNGTRLYIPVPGSSDAASPTKQTPKPIAPLKPKEKKSERRARAPPSDDCMQVEDTPNRVYIADLAAELSDIESDEENPIFLSDIEKHLSKIPEYVLRAPGPTPTEFNQMVLYNIPSSLTVPEEQDNVRKAIIEARARMRERQANGIGEPERVNEAMMEVIPNTTAAPAAPAEAQAVEEDDVDAMELG